MNLLFVVDKPIHLSSNRFLGQLKRKYGTKKMGFSGTLDPFASGCLIVAAGQYTRLFQYLAKTPKTYRATLWLGADSSSLDIENIRSIRDVPPVDPSRILQVLASLEGELEYLPPKYSAKKIAGERAYALARAGESLEMRPIRSTVHSIRLLHYRHPFVTFEATVSEGTYIRSLGAMIAEALERPGTLSALRRLREGTFSVTEGERPLDPLDYLSPPRNAYSGDPAWIDLGKKLDRRFFAHQENGLYVVETERFFAILEFDDEGIKYRLNRIEKFLETEP